MLHFNFFYNELQSHKESVMTYLDVKKGEKADFAPNPWWFLSHII